MDNINPLVMGFLRGVFGGFLVGAGAAVKEMVAGVPFEQAALVGAIPAIAIWAGLLGYGVYDQYRVAEGKVSSADVPIQLAAKTSHKTPAAVAADFAPSKLR